jgi:hypothetical protein
MSTGASPANRVAELGQMLGSASGARIFDQEQFTRELLLSKLSTLLDSNHFDVCPLEDMRRMLGEIFLEPVDKVRVPQHLRAVHCVKYSEFSPVNRRRIIDLTFEYIGLTEARAEYALTKDGWATVKAMVEKLCAGGEVGPAVGSDASDPPASAGMAVVTNSDAQWSREVLVNTIKSILVGNRFSICQLDAASHSLNSLRSALGLSEVGCEKHPGYAGLRALHCCDFEDMEPAMASRIPGMVLSVLGLSSGNGSGDGEVLLGQALWADVRSAYDAGIKVLSCEPAVQKTVMTKGSLWASLRAALRHLFG